MCSTPRWRRSSRSSPAALHLHATPGTLSAPIWWAASNASQKPRNGPNEKGKKMRSPGPTRAAWYTVFQQSTSHCQLSVVSSQRSGNPEVEDVWQYRCVAFEGLAQRRAPGRIRCLVGHEFALSGQWQLREILRKPQRCDRNSRLIELARVKRIPAVGLGEQSFETANLVLSHGMKRGPRAEGSISPPSRRGRCADQIKVTLLCAIGAAGEVTPCAKWLTSPAAPII